MSERKYCFRACLLLSRTPQRESQSYFTAPALSQRCVCVYKQNAACALTVALRARDGRVVDVRR